MEIILFIITVIIGVLLLCGISFIIIDIIFWKTDICKTSPRISYDAFVKWYKVTPKERWVFYDTYVRFYTKKYKYKYSCIDEYHTPITIEFKSYLDVLKYKRLRKNGQSWKQKWKNRKGLLYY